MGSLYLFSQFVSVQLSSSMPDGRNKIYFGTLPTKRGNHPMLLLYDQTVFDLALLASFNALVGPSEFKLITVII